MPSEVASESADYGEIGQIWERLLTQGARIRELVDRLDGVSIASFEDFKGDMGMLVSWYVTMREGLMELHEQIGDLQRGLMTARDADQNFGIRSLTLSERSHI